MIDSIYFSDNGKRLNATWTGDNTTIVIHIIEGHSKLIFHRGVLDVFKDEPFYIIALNDIKHKIFCIYDEKEENLLFKIENKYGNIDIESMDNRNYMKSIGNNLSFNMLALPLFEIFLDKIYDHNKCKVEESDIIFDIGANIGTFSFYSLYKGAKRCYLFEPNKKLCDSIKNQNIENIIIENVAVSNKNEKINFLIDRGGITSCLEKDMCFIMDDNNFGNIRKLNKKTYYKEKSIIKKIKVDSINLMDYILFNKIDKIDYLKIDCEGSEYDIIESINDNYLKKNIKKILLEYHYLLDENYKMKFHKMINKLIDCGFMYENNRNIEQTNHGILFLWKN